MKIPLFIIGILLILLGIYLWAGAIFQSKIDSHIAKNCLVTTGVYGLVRNPIFDVVTCSMSFHHYPDPEQFFMSLNRVLRPGGRLVLRDMASNSRLIMWFVNHMEIPFINRILRKGDVHIY